MPPAAGVSAQPEEGTASVSEEATVSVSEPVTASVSKPASTAGEDEDLYSLFRCSGDRRAPIKVELKLDDRPVSMELDTGAALSVCGERIFRQLWPVNSPVMGVCSYCLKT